MKRIRGFTEPYDPEEWEEVEDFLEHGFASEHVDGHVHVRDYTCPRCNHVLFTADVDLHGVIFIHCRRCRREVAIETEPTMRRIGFIDKLHTKETPQCDSSSFPLSSTPKDSKTRSSSSLTARSRRRRTYDS